jgi:uncharacterized protein YjdB
MHVRTVVTLAAVLLGTACEVPVASRTDVGPGVVSVLVQPHTVTLLVGDTLALSATVTVSNNAPTDSVSWATSNATLATVSPKGVVRGVATGTSIIHAVNGSGRDSAAVTVVLPSPLPVASVSVAPGSATLAIAATVQLLATPKDAAGNPLGGRAVTWSSANPATATVSGSGVVTAVAAGSAAITAASEGQRGTATVTVTPAPPAPVASLTVTPATASVLPGQTVQLSATIRDASGNVLTGRTITWTSSALSIAAVDGTGLVTALVAGPATVTAMSEGKSASAGIAVNVLPPPPSSGDPAPAAGATIYRDTRPGGAQDLQAAVVTTLGQADGLLGAVNMTNPYGAWDFTTNLDGQGRHAYMVKWSGVGANCPIDAIATRIIYFPTAPTHVFYQWKQWMGRTATGGGIGTVGDFTINNPNCNNSGRKMWLAYRTPDDANGRVDYVWHPAGLDLESWYGITPNPGTIFQNLGRDFNPEQAIGQVNTYTLEYQAESAPGASDGLVRLWVNGVKRMEYLRAPTGSQGFGEIEFPTMMRAPLRDQTEYFWDVVIWTP